MAAGAAGGERICEHLQESLARLREDIDRVELWANALEGFARPVPDYDPARRYRLSADNDDTPAQNRMKRDR
jgi:hypothetical protein